MPAQPAPPTSTESPIRVFVRIRPQPSESSATSSGISIAKKSKISLADPQRASTLSQTTKTFVFDHVFAGNEASQSAIFDRCARDLVDEMLGGFSCTLFAYGQTGTGKTYTMSGTPDQQGVIPRTLDHIFDKGIKCGDQLDLVVKISYVELYNEVIHDLLAPIENVTSSKLKIYETADGSCKINCTEIMCSSKAEAIDAFQKGTLRRQTAETALNTQSSRSHAVFIINTITDDKSIDKQIVKFGKLNLVDLAGSENISKSMVTDIRKREANSINLSLLSLGKVITALAMGRSHIPYRESKLTRLLKDSLGGKTKTAMIATVSPLIKNHEETRSTLEYAHNCKNIYNRPEINTTMNQNNALKVISQDFEKLQHELQAARSGTGFYVNKENYDTLVSSNESMQAGIAQLETELEEKNESLKISTYLNDYYQTKINKLDEALNYLVPKHNSLNKTAKDNCQNSDAYNSTVEHHNSEYKKFYNKTLDNVDDLITANSSKRQEDSKFQSGLLSKFKDEKSTSTSWLTRFNNDIKESESEMKSQTENASQEISGNFAKFTAQEKENIKEFKTVQNMLVKCSEELDSLADSSSSDVSEEVLRIKKSLEITQKNLKNALSKSFKITNDLKSVNSELENFALEKVFDDNDQMGQFDLENLQDIHNITESLIQKKKEFLKRNSQTKNTSVLSMQKIVEMLSKNISNSEENNGESSKLFPALAEDIAKTVELKTTVDKKLQAIKQFIENNTKVKLKDRFDVNIEESQAKINDIIKINAETSAKIENLNKQFFQKNVGSLKESVTDFHQASIDFLKKEQLYLSDHAKKSDKSNEQITNSAINIRDLLDENKFLIKKIVNQPIECETATPPTPIKPKDEIIGENDSPVKKRPKRQRQS